MSLDKIVVVGTRTTLDIAAQDVATETYPDYAVPSQARADKQKLGHITKDVSGGAEVTLTAAEALNKVLRPTGQDAAYTVNVPDDCLLIVDTTAGTDASANDATISATSGTVTVSDGHGAVVVVVGGTPYKLDVAG